jgi:protein involved in polysaccharide export with SLBB domain
MRVSLTANLKRTLAGFGSAASLITVSLLSSGCGHLAYVDPNPSAPYAFPGTQSRTASLTPPAQQTGWTPSTGSAPVLPSAQVNPGPAVNVPPNSMVPPAPIESYRGTGLLTIGENVTISYSDLPAISQWPDTKQRIGDDGRIILPFNVSVVAAGKTCNQLAEDVRKEYVPKYFVRFTATVKTEERFYFVGGEVKIPNRQIYMGDMTVLRAIDTAGGFNDFADRTKIELRRANGQQKFIVNAKKASQNPKLDLVVYPNDQIVVPKRGVFKF